MKKSCSHSILLYLFLVHVLYLQARNENQPPIYFSPLPIHQSFSAAHAQNDPFQQDPYNFHTPQNSSFLSTSSGQDWYQQHRQFILSNVVSVQLQGKAIKITPEDIALINRICADNPHKNQDELRMKLAESSAFNYVQHFLKGDRQLQAFTSDIYINPAHFKQVSATDYRIKKMMDAAKDAMYDRHKREISQLQSAHKEQLKTAKKKSKTEENKVAVDHKKEWAALQARHKEEKKHPLGSKQPKKAFVESSSQSQIAQQVTPEKVPKKLHVNVAELQNLGELNKQNLTIHRQVRLTDDVSFQQVMQARAQAFESSINNTMPVFKNIIINSQTAAFLESQDIDSVYFAQIEGLPIQHQLTHELVDVLDVIAEYAQQHHYEIYQTHLTNYCAHLASLSQQANQQGALQQAIDGTNCCHGIQHYLQGMVSGVGQAYQQFQTALDYFDTVADSYRTLITQHVLQGAVIAHGLETIVTAGMIAAPTATVAATGIVIGATAYVMAPLCAQAMIDTASFGGACITGNWDKVATDLDNFGTFISSPQTIARMAELAGGAAMSTPNLNYVVDQVLSLRPVITSVQNVSGEMVQSLYLMTKNQLQKVYTQGLELLQFPEFTNFNMSYKNICGFNFFDILPQSHPALVGAFSGLESGVMSSAEQAALTQLFTQAEGSVAGNIITSGASSIGSQAVQAIEQGVKSLITKQIDSIAQLHEVLQHEIMQSLKQPILSIDLTAKITDAKYVELKELSSQIRQLQDLAKYTDNFKNLENLIPEDICYLNRLYELQPYRIQIKNFLDTYKPYFMYENQQYFIEDIASYHIHAGEYLRKEKPKGGHSNHGGHKFDYFNPQVTKHGPVGAKDVIFYNSRNANLTKQSGIYPEIWSEFVCDLKAIEVMTSKNTDISLDSLGVLTFRGKTSESLDVVVHYDIAYKRIRSHYPDSEKF